MVNVQVDSVPVQPQNLDYIAQSSSYPGGKRYALVSSDSDLCHSLLKRFPGNVHEQLDKRTTAYVFNLLRMFVELKHGRSKTEFVANTIDKLEVAETLLRIEGECSEWTD